MITRHQTQYLAWQLASAIVDARIELNPHQADAALFNLQNSGTEDIDAPTFASIEVYPHRWVPRRGGHTT